MDSEEEDKLAQIADLLKALGHSVRMQILFLLTEYEELKVSSIQTELQIEQSALSHHLIKMKDKRILKSRRVGRELHYSINNPDLTTLLSSLCSSFGISYFDFLKKVLPGHVTDSNKGYY